MESAAPPAQALKASSDRAWRGDVARWARLLLMASGPDPGDEVACAPVLWDQLRPSYLSRTRSFGAVAEAKASFAVATGAADER